MSGSNSPSRRFTEIDIPDESTGLLSEEHTTCTPTLLLTLAIVFFVIDAAAFAVTLALHLIPSPGVYGGFGAVLLAVVVLAAVGLARRAAQRGSKSLTLEFTAAKTGRIDLLSQALAHGFDVNSKSPDGVTCLQFASQFGHAPCVDVLLRAGADPNISCKNSYPILEAAAGGYLQTVERLVDAQADVNVVAVVTTNTGSSVHLTALILASLKNHPKVVRFLLARGVDPNAKPQGSFPALLCAAKAGHRQVVRELYEAGADMNITNANGSTALHLAVLHKHVELVQDLLRFSCDASIPDKLGRTAKQVALEMRLPSIVELLSQSNSIQAPSSP